MADYNYGTDFGAAPLVSPIAGVRRDKPRTIGAADNALAPLSLDSVGALRVSTEGGRTTFSGSLSNVALAASSTNIFTIGGSASAIVKITRIELEIEGTAADVEVALRKQSTADSGGTATAMTIVPHDTGNLPVAVPGDIVAQGYTAVPTQGTNVGNLRASKYDCAAAGTAGSPPIVWDFTRPGIEPPTLRGVAQQLAVALPTLSVTNGKLTISIEGVLEPQATG